MKSFLVSSKNTNPSLLSYITGVTCYQSVTNSGMPSPSATGTRHAANTNISLLTYITGITFYQTVTNRKEVPFARWRYSQNTNPSLLSCTTGAGYYHDVTNPEQYISTGPKDTEDTNLNLLSYTGGITYYQVVANLVNLGHSIIPPDGALRKSNSCRILSFFHFLIPVSGRLNSPVRYVVFYYFFTHFHPGR